MAASAILQVTVFGVERTNGKMPEKVCGWLVRCTACGMEWLLEVSFDISEAKRLYHYCSRCKRNTFHEILKRIEFRAS